MLNKLYQTVQLLTYSTVWFAEVLCHAGIEYNRHLSQYLRELEGPCSNFGSCLFGICIVNSSELGLCVPQGSKGPVYHRDQKVHSSNYPALYYSRKVKVLF